MAEYSADNPISCIEEDCFQRKQFALRIANTIASYENQKSIVLGLYGEWGFGKSSVLNMVESSLNNNNNIVIVRFNPWRFSNESFLLNSFFESLASKIKSIEEEKNEYKGSWNRIGEKTLSYIKNRSSIKTGKEQIGDLLRKYASSVSSIPIAGLAVKGVSEYLSVDIETLKSRLNRMISDTKKKILVIIDDIDRLDKNEIYSLLRLVKLNADFSNTIYLLSFDEKMVAKAIGDRFGNNDFEAGRSFLEKIVQTQIPLPMIPPDDMRSFCFSEINKILASKPLDTQIKQDDLGDFPYFFSGCILPVVKTPRLAIRYVNALKFVLPMLVGEVYIADLMLLEALKIFYPEIYDYIKNNTLNFMKCYSSSDSNDENERLNFEKTLNNFFEKLDTIQRDNLKKILKRLFPYLNSVYARIDNTSSYPIWIQKKQICTIQYYKRYFMYTVLTGEISDLVYQSFINEICLKSFEENKGKITRLINDSDGGESLYEKIFINYKDYSTEVLICLLNLIFSVSDIIPTKSDFLSTSIASRMAFLCTEMMLKMEEDKQLDELKAAISYINNAAFLVTIWSAISQNKKIDGDFKKDILEFIANKVVEISSDDPIFINNDISWPYFMSEWKKQDEKSIYKYSHDYLDKHPNDILKVIYHMGMLSQSSNRRGTYKCSLNKEQYNTLSSLFSADYIYQCIIKAYPDEIGRKAVWPEHIDDSNSLDYVRQFCEFYKGEDN